jgi:Transposase Tn5 dimerisation domain/Transposase DNA-binding/Transposase DDE domain
MIAPWAKEECARAHFGDERLDDRMAILLSELGNRPILSIPAACGGRADMKAAYRFFDNDKVTFEKVIEPHVTQTKERMAAQEVVLLVQDTTEVDLTRPEQAVEGAGELDGARRGFLLHEIQAFVPDGTPLGTVWAEVLNRTEGVSHAPAAEKSQQRKQTPIEEKESFRWLSGLREARKVAQELPTVQCVCVADSEADIYEVFAEPRGEYPVHWLIRACQDRATDGDAGQRLRDRVLATPVLYQVELLIRGRNAKLATEDRARRQNRETRRATVEVRAASVTLRPPYRPDRKLPPVTVNVVLVREPNPPAGETPVEWILVTTLPIDTLEQVRTIVEYYCVRWSIEILFRTLKSGCRIEQRRLEHIDRMLPCLGIYLIVAWRVMFVCRMGRSCPDIDCEAIFEPSEWKAVWVAVKRQQPPKKPPRLADMVHLIASLGGYIKRKGSEPGTQTLWVGLQRVYDLAWAWDTFGPGAKIGGG